MRAEADTPPSATTPPTARSYRPPPSAAKKSDLLRDAAALGIRGRSTMSKADLERAIRARRHAVPES